MQKSVKKKKRSGVIGELPLDCWGNMLMYFSDRKDFISVLLTVKGLWEYCRLIRPSVSTYVEYTLRRIPSERVLHVTNLYVPCHNSSLMLEFEKERLVKCNEIFRKFMSLFPNIKTFLLALNKESDDDDCGYVIDETVKSTSVNGIQVAFSPNSEVKTLEISSHFPNLLSLHLEHYGYKKRKFVTRTLRVNFANIPRVHKLVLRGWDLKSDMSLASNLRVLQIEKSIVRRIPKMKNLRALFFKGGDTMNHLESIRSNLCLQKLVFRTIEPLPDLVQNPTKFNVEFTGTFQSLKVFGLFIHGYSTREFCGGVLLLDQSRFPCLEAVNIESSEDNTEDLTFRIQVDLPKLKWLSVCDWVSFELLRGVHSLGIVDSLTLKSSPNVENVIFENLSHLKHLTELVLCNHNSLSEIEVVEDMSSLRKLSIIDLPNVKLVVCYDAFISEIRGCPSLKQVGLIPFKDFVMDEQTQDVSMWVHFISKIYQSDPQSFVQRITSRNKMSMVIVFPVVYRHLEMIGGSFEKHLDSLNFFYGSTGRGESDEHRLLQFYDMVYDILEESGFAEVDLFGLKVRDFKYITKLSICCQRRFPHEVIISDLPELSYMDLGTKGTSTKPAIFSRLILKNLPKLKQLRIGIGFTSIDYVYFENTRNITQLVISLFYLSYSERRLVARMSVRNNEFPNLIFLDITISKFCEKGRGDTLQSIGSLTKLKCLKQIAIDIEKDVYQFWAPFHQVHGIDTDSVVIRSKLFDKEGSEDSLKKFITEMNSMSKIITVFGDTRIEVLE